MDTSVPSGLGVLNFLKHATRLCISTRAFHCHCIFDENKKIHSKQATTAREKIKRNARIVYLHCMHFICLCPFRMRLAILIAFYLGNGHYLDQSNWIRKCFLATLYTHRHYELPPNCSNCVQSNASFAFVYAWTVSFVFVCPLFLLYSISLVCFSFSFSFTVCLRLNCNCLLLIWIYQLQ